jgi:hypothetical protein
MSAQPVNKWISYPMQAVCYGAFMAVVGYFATSPAYVHLPPGQALVKLSFQHAGQRKEACRERSAEARKLAPFMRAASDCPREQAPLVVDIRWTTSRCSLIAPPRDFPRRRLYRLPPRGRRRRTHRSRRLADSVDGTLRFTGQRTVDLKPGRVIVIDFDAKEGCWVFRE